MARRGAEAPPGSLEKFDIILARWIGKLPSRCIAARWAVDQDYKNILMHASRVAPSRRMGWAMLATELQDILFGTPYPGRRRGEYGRPQEDQVNNNLSTDMSLSSRKMIAAASRIRAAREREVGANGSRRGDLLHGQRAAYAARNSIAGTFLNQELVIATEHRKLMAVDVQCVMQGLTSIASATTPSS